MILVDWNRARGSYEPSRIAMHPDMVAAFRAWHRDHDVQSGTATRCTLDCRAGVYVHGSELRLRRGRWTQRNLSRLAALISYTGEQVVRRG